MEAPREAVDDFQETVSGPCPDVPVPVAATPGDGSFFGTYMANTGEFVGQAVGAPVANLLTLMEPVMILFLGISASALRCRSFDLFAVLPENFREALGAPPPVDLIHLVLAASTVSALILIAGRAGEGRCGSGGWLQFGMSVFFYPLYAVTNTLETWFPAVFAAGLIVLVVEHFSVWARASRAIQEEKERLERMT